MASISVPALAGLTPEAFAKFSAREIGALTTTQVASLTSSEIATLTLGKLSAMGSDQIAAIGPEAFAALGARKIRHLGAAQLSGLTSGQIAVLSGAEIGNLNVDAVTTGALTTLSPAQVAALSASAVAGFGVAEFDQVLANNVQFLSSLSGASVADLQSLNAAQFGALADDELSALGGAFLSQFNPELFTPEQISGLSGATIAGMTTIFFSQLSNPDLAAISTTAISGMTAAQLQALSAGQIASFTPEQIAAMSPSQLTVVGATNPLLVQAIQLEVDGNLSYSGALALLENAAVGGMNATKFADLQTVANLLQTQDEFWATGSDDAILTSAAVEKLFDNVVLGDAENAQWNGGAGAPTTLGNLSAATTQAQFEELISKWFLGGDLPGLQVDASGHTIGAAYQPSNLPLYRPSGAPAMTDVLQGGLADSALLAGIAETTLQDPAYIQSLITANGNGTYTVEIPDYWNNLFVSVNNQLPVAANGAGLAFANSATGDWAALLEKAAAQLSVDTVATNNDGSPSLGDQYASLTLSSADQLALFSGQYDSSFTFYSVYSNSELELTLSAAQQVFARGSNVVLQAGNQYFAVTGIDAADGTVGVYNPLGGASSTVSLASMVAGQDTLYFATSARAPI